MAGFNPSFRIQGQVYHLIGNIVPTQGEYYKFSKTYFIGDEDSEVATGFTIVDGLKPDIIRSINRLLHETITVQKCLKWPRKSLKKILPLM